MANLLVTGAAGFIGYHLIQALLEKADQIVGIDSLDNHYKLELKIDLPDRKGIELKRREADSVVQGLLWLS